jgi:hypothetical protein
MRFCPLIGIGALAAAAMACAAHEPRAVSDSTTAPTAAREYSAGFILTWANQRIGHASERLTRRDDGGYELVREEQISIRRGDTPVQMHTTVRIAADPALRAESVAITRRSAGTEIRGHSTRAADGNWRVSFGDQPERPLHGDAIPLELMPLLLARQPRFEGTAMLFFNDTATAEIYARPTAGDEHRVVVALVVPAGVLTNELLFHDDGRLSRIDAPGGVESYRAEPNEIDSVFEPPELVDAASIAVAGAAHGGASMTRIVLEGVTAPEPPALPGQLLKRKGDRWEVTLTAGFSSADVDRALTTAGSSAPPNQELASMADAIVAESKAQTPADELSALAQYTDRLIENDLTAPPPDARTAFALGRGDCTAHATVFAAFATARGFDVRLVTGFRLSNTDEGHRLVRHRWAVARIDDRWVTVDPTYGEAPASAVLLGLTAHGTSAAELAIIDELVFAGFGRATARFAAR